MDPLIIIKEIFPKSHNLCNILLLFTVVKAHYDTFSLTFILYFIFIGLLI